MQLISQENVYADIAKSQLSLSKDVIEYIVASAVTF